MAIQIIKEHAKKPTTAQKLAGGLEKALPMLGQMQEQRKAEQLQQKEKKATSDYLKSLGLPPEVGNMPAEFQKELVKQYGKYGARKTMFENSPFAQFLGGEQNEMPGESNQPNQFSDQVNPQGEIDIGKVGLSQERKEVPENMIFQAEAMGEHALAQQLRSHNEGIEREKKTRRKIFEGDRKYHTEFSKKAEEEAEGMRSSLPKKEMSLNFARDAISTGNLDYFSKDKLADVTGMDVFRTAKGAQLITAGKENLLSNMSRVTGRAQNMWFEQRLNSMFPKIGQSKEANLTVQEMLEGELAMDQAYLNEFDKQSQRDMQDYGYLRRDISKRSRDAIKPLEKDIMQRTTYRMKEIEDQEKGLKGLQSEVGKNVPKGTPMTLQMLALYNEKFGENAIKVGEKNGYYVPTYEEWQRYQGMEVNE